MGLETATYINSLVDSNPDGSTDQRSTADDHLRLIKAAVKRTLPMLAGAVSASHQAISYVNDLNAPIQAQINSLRGGEGSATVFAALSCRTANSASYAALAGTAALANFATTAQDAVNATNAVSAITAVTATNAGSAAAANFASVASNALQLNGTPAAGYAQLAVAQSWSKGQAISQVNSSGTSLTPDCDASTMFRHTMTGTTTISAPTTARSGMVITIHLIQDGTGSRTASWSGVYRFPAATAPTLSTAAGQRDVFCFQYDSTSVLWFASGLGVA